MTPEQARRFYLNAAEGLAETGLHGYTTVPGTSPGLAWEAIAGQRMQAARDPAVRGGHYDWARSPLTQSLVKSGRGDIARVDEMLAMERNAGLTPERAAKLAAIYRGRPGPNATDEQWQEYFARRNITDPAQQAAERARRPTGVQWSSPANPDYMNYLAYKRAADKERYAVARQLQRLTGMPAGPMTTDMVNNWADVLAGRQTPNVAHGWVFGGRRGGEQAVAAQQEQAAATEKVLQTLLPGWQQLFSNMSNLDKDRAAQYQQLFSNLHNLKKDQLGLFQQVFDNLFNLQREDAGRAQQAVENFFTTWNLLRDMNHGKPGGDEAALVAALELTKLYMNAAKGRELTVEDAYRKAQETVAGTNSDSQQQPQAPSPARQVLDMLSNMFSGKKASTEPGSQTAPPATTTPQPQTTTTPSVSDRLLQLFGSLFGNKQEPTQPGSQTAPPATTTPPAPQPQPQPTPPKKLSLAPIRTTEGTIDLAKLPHWVNTYAKDALSNIETMRQVRQALAEEGVTPEELEEFRRRNYDPAPLSWWRLAMPGSLNTFYYPDSFDHIEDGWRKRVAELFAPIRGEDEEASRKRIEAKDLINAILANYYVQ